MEVKVKVKAIAGFKANAAKLGTISAEDAKEK